MNKKTLENQWFDKEDFIPDHDRLFEYVSDNLIEIVKKHIPLSLHQEPIICVTNIKEEPILNGYPPIYPDLLFSINVYKKHTNFKIVIEDIYNTYKKKCSICDLETHHHFDSYKKEERDEEIRNVETMVCGSNFDFILEIKPKITSFGSVLRQINMYRTRLNGIQTALLVTLDKNYNCLDKRFTRNKNNVIVVNPQCGHCKYGVSPNLGGFRSASPAGA